MQNMCREKRIFKKVTDFEDLDALSVLRNTMLQNVFILISFKRSLICRLRGARV